MLRHLATTRRERLPDGILFLESREVPVDVGKTAMPDVNGEDLPMTELTVIQFCLHASGELIG